MKSLFKPAFLNALATAAYVSLVGSFIFYASKLKLGDHTPLVPIFMLMLLVFSVSLCGALIFGRPLLWHMDGRKKEALALLGYTLVVFFILLLLALGGLVLLGK